MSQEVVRILELYLQNNSFKSNSTEEFLKLSGSWDDDREADQIITEIYNSRKSFKRFQDWIFD